MKKLLWATAASLAILTPGLATAQDGFPAQSITILVPAAAGGPSDTVARLVAEAMRVELDSPVIIENMGGAGGSLGAGRVAQADPDGYTLMLYHVAVATFGPLYENLAYEPATAFESVGMVTEVPMTLVGRSDLPADDVASLIDYLRAEGDVVTLGTAGVGAVSDLCGRLLAEALGVEFTVIPYQGTGPALNDLMGGQIDVMCDQTTNTANPINAGTIKPYAVTTRERIDLFPDLPTLAESGLDGFEITAWHAIWAPAGTPEDIRERLAEALRVALEDEGLIERFDSLGTVPVPAELATPAALDEHFASEIERWGTLLANPAQ